MQRLMRVKVSFASFPIFAICLLAKGAKVSVKINVKKTAMTRRIPNTRNHFDFLPKVFPLSSQVLQKYDANHLGRQPILRNAPIMPNHLGRRRTLERAPRISDQPFLTGSNVPLALSPGFVSDVVDYSVPVNPVEAQGTRQEQQGDQGTHQGQHEDQGTRQESQSYFVDASDSKMGCGVAPLRCSSVSQNDESNAVYHCLL